MAFEGVDVGSLVQALNDCKNSLNYSSSKKANDAISDPMVWQNSAKVIVKEALQVLLDRYSNLEGLISSYLGLAGLIAEYQKLQKKNKELAIEFDMLKPKLYYTVTYTETDKDGNEHTYSETKMDYAVNARMNAICKEIEKNKKKMDEIEAAVAAGVGA